MQLKTLVGCNCIGLSLVIVIVNVNFPKAASTKKNKTKKSHSIEKILFPLALSSQK